MYIDVKSVLTLPIVPRILSLVLFVLVVWQLFSTIVTLSFKNPIDSQPAQNEMPRATGHDNHLKEALNTPFFGEYVPDSLDDANIQQSMLNLKVVGIIYSEQEGHSAAIIRTPDEKELLFHVGDALPGGVIIKKITPEGVLVGREGGLERLSLPKDELQFEDQPKPLDTKQNW